MSRCAAPLRLKLRVPVSSILRIYPISQDINHRAPPVGIIGLPVSGLRRGHIGQVRVITASPRVGRELCTLEGESDFGPGPTILLTGLCEPMPVLVRSQA